LRERGMRLATMAMVMSATFPTRSSGGRLAFSLCQLSTPKSRTRSHLRLFATTRLVDDMLYRVRQVNNVPDDIRAKLLDFVVDGKVLGKVTPNTAQLLESVLPDVPAFEIASGTPCTSPTVLTLSKHAGTTPESRTHAVAQAMEFLREQGVVKGWRDEMYPVTDSFYSEPTFVIERAAASLLGVVEYGVHINGLVQDQNGNDKDRLQTNDIKMWIARRSLTKSKFPGMLDHLVAGGQPAHMGLMENVIKECEEEAGIPEATTSRGIQAGGAVGYESFHNDRISSVVLFCYDLYLPDDFIPKAVDGEVHEFFLWSVDELKESMRPDYHDPIKPNCYLVIIDFLLRAGLVSPEIPGYLDLARELRSGPFK